MASCSSSSSSSSSTSSSSIIMAMLALVALALASAPVCFCSSPPSGPASLMADRHIRLYFHDLLNYTVFQTVPGVPGIPLTTTTAPFGSTFASSDPITETPSLNSTPLGLLMGTFTTISLDGHSFLSVLTVNLHHTGTLSILGVFSFVQPSLRLPIVGGSGAFQFAQGTATIKTIGMLSTNQTFQLDLYLHMP